MTKSINTEQINGVSTYDLSLASALKEKGFVIARLDRDSHPHKIKFIFKPAKGIKEAEQKYWADRMVVNPRTYSDTVKSIKNRIYSN